MSIYKCMKELNAMNELLHREMTNEATEATLDLDANPINVHYAIGVLTNKIMEAIYQLEQK